MITKAQIKGTYDDLTKRYVIKMKSPLSLEGSGYYLLGFHPGTSIPEFTFSLHRAMVYEYSAMTDEYVGICKEPTLNNEAWSMNKRGNFRSGLKGDVWALRHSNRVVPERLRLVTLKKRREE